VNFRPIADGDVGALFDVRTRTRENSYTLAELHRLGITPESVRARLATTFAGWLCADGDRVVAFAMADRSAGELWVIAVLSEYEGRGIGGELMRRAEEWLWTSGLRACMADDRRRHVAARLRFLSAPRLDRLEDRRRPALDGAASTRASTARRRRAHPLMGVTPRRC
jgi:GNAT superfamily N-acetyltransferase